MVSAEVTESLLSKNCRFEGYEIPPSYLASDDLKGRGFGRPELDTAAAYIAAQFQKAGAQPLPGADGYFQVFDAIRVRSEGHGTVSLGGRTFHLGSDALQWDPSDADVDAPVVFVNDTASLGRVEVKGTIVYIDGKLLGNVLDITGVRSRIVSRGAVGLILGMEIDSNLWKRMGGMFQELNVRNPAETTQLPVVFVHGAVTGATRAGIAIAGTVTEKVRVKNVLACIPGTDPALQREYVMLSAHYDHLGVGTPQMEEGKLDSIYNGARDNATGSAAVIDAGYYFAQHPAKRPILLATFTAEEEGLIGSSYYAVHPLVPLAQTVYDLNIDNASYNDTTLITLVGLGRTTADPMIKAAAAHYGLHVGDDPTGGELFTQSDNYPLAARGVPAPTFSLGMKTFDATIFDRYHRMSDEVGNMNLRYIVKFILTYIMAAQSIADGPAAPQWTKL